ncbi:MAG: hypothetical protein FWE32_10305, partial [Oscillospiraceae bacterium]|nr:hypothetical protein [Oscillospiraceae bacterium]
FAKRLKALRGLSPYEFIVNSWVDKPELFHSVPSQLILGRYRFAVSAYDEAQTAGRQIKDSGAEFLRLLTKLSAKECRIADQKAILFEDFAFGKMSKGNYLELKSALTAEGEEVLRQKSEIESKAQSVPPVPEKSHIFGLLGRLDGIQEVTPELVFVSFVERIDVFSSERVEMRFAFAGELERLCCSAFVEPKL